MCDDVAGEDWSESGDALDESVFVFPVFHGVAADLSIEMFCLFLKVDEVVVFIA